MKNEFILSEVILPEDIKGKILSSELSFSKFYARNPRDELRELIIHLKNTEISGLVILGGKESIEVLQNIQDELIDIFAGKNSSYFFKIYINKNSNDAISFIMIDRDKGNIIN
ncbi:hypothetical protein [Limnobaculum parvum]|uniref:Uncharacterized protein n=1 Tax=Limnobaculum parvum TaxID=2172103 RepID=A0A2Y9TY12_9GAMM|nr:hypothetical protein [Limnobaculum parvum]AWH88638.1 hypothetical protein HYN51_08730 [Limnobaculum parvum]